MTAVNMSSSHNASVRYHLPCYEHAQASFAPTAASAAHMYRAIAAARPLHQQMTLTALT